MTDPWHPAPVIRRHVNGLICAYTPTPGELGVLAPAMAWKPSHGDEVTDHTAAADLQRAGCSLTTSRHSSVLAADLLAPFAM